MGYESTMQQWREGARRLTEASPEELRVLDRVVDRVYAELRRRLGSTFSAAELVDLYEAGTLWAEQLAMRAAPDHPWAWDPRIAIDASFARYVREAADYAGGRRLTGRAGTGS
jgi:hypothetical protein